jgi:hypothetical protein
MPKSRKNPVEAKVIFGGLLIGVFLWVSVIFIKTLSIQYLHAKPQSLENILITPYITALPLDRFNESTDTNGQSLSGVFELEMKVSVSGTGNDGLRMRKQPGITEEILYIASEGEILKIIDGPQIIESQIWWGLVSQDNPIKSGWSVQDFLEPLK